MSGRAEPIRLQALAQSHAGAVQRDPQIGRRDAQLLTDLFGLAARAIRASGTRGRACSAIDRRKPRGRRRTGAGRMPILRVPPVLRHLATVTVARGTPGRRCLSSPSSRLDATSRVWRRNWSISLCLRMPTSQVLSWDWRAKRLRLFECGQQGFGHGVFGPGPRCATAPRAKRSSCGRSASTLPAGEIAHWLKRAPGRSALQCKVRPRGERPTAVVRTDCVSGPTSQRSTPNRSSPNESTSHRFVRPCIGARAGSRRPGGRTGQEQGKEKCFGIAKAGAERLRQPRRHAIRAPAMSKVDNDRRASGSTLPRALART